MDFIIFLIQITLNNFIVGCYYFPARAFCVCEEEKKEFCGSELQQMVVLNTFIAVTNSQLFFLINHLCGRCSCPGINRKTWRLDLESQTFTFLHQAGIGSPALLKLYSHRPWQQAVKQPLPIKNLCKCTYMYFGLLCSKVLQSRVAKTIFWYYVQNMRHWSFKR